MLENQTIEFNSHDLKNLARALKLIPVENSPNIEEYLKDFSIKIPEKVMELYDGVELFDINEFKTEKGYQIKELARTFRNVYKLRSDDEFDHIIKKFIDEGIIDQIIFSLRRDALDDKKSGSKNKRKKKTYKQRRKASASETNFRSRIMESMIKFKCATGDVPKLMNTGYFTQQDRMEYLKMLFANGFDKERKVFREHRARWLRVYYVMNCPDKELPFLLGQKNLNDTHSSAIIKVRMAGYDIKGKSPYRVRWDYQQGRYPNAT